VDWALPDAGQVTLVPDFIPAERRLALFEALRAEVPFAPRQIKIFGRSVDQPRLTAWIGDQSAVYTYSGVTLEPAPWPPALAALRERVSAVAELRFNSVLCNLYRDGRDSMGMHSDSERELGQNPVIASVSLGAVRRFQLRHRKRKGIGLDLDLPDGSLLIMRGALQHHYRHGVPKQPQIQAPRINLTFRRIS
jgi:alkylated DNA repair dioxygenase AlkB